MVDSTPVSMPVKQVFIVRCGSAERFRALQETFGAAPISATITWDRREGARRRRRQRAHIPPSARRRAEHRGSEPSSWAALDFLVSRPAGVQPAMDGSGTARSPANPVDGDLLVLRETSVNGPCSVSTDPGPAHVLLPSYEEAVSYAERLADRVGGSVWYTEDHNVFIAVRRRRDQTAVP